MRIYIRWPWRDPRMLELTGDLRLFDEPTRRVRCCRIAVEQQLDRHVAIESRIACGVDDPHSPASDFIEQLITSTDEFSAGDGGRSTADIRRKADGRREWWVGFWSDGASDGAVARHGSVIERLASQWVIRM